MDIRGKHVKELDQIIGVLNLRDVQKYFGCQLSLGIVELYFLAVALA